MANALIKRLVHDGDIEVNEAPLRRYGCHITPQGFIEKGRLVSKYIANSFKFFGEARRDYEAIACQIGKLLSLNAGNRVTVLLQLLEHFVHGQIDCEAVVET